MPTPPRTTPPRYALVTGGASGIGREVCRQLATLGWRVAVADINTDAAEATAAQLPPGAARAEPLDVAQSGQWQSLIDRLRAAWPRLDLLVGNAGVLVGGPLATTPAESLERVIDVNLKGTLLGCRATLPWLIETATRDRPTHRDEPRSGVIATASIFAALAPPGFAAYNAGKAGVVALAESLRGELQPHGLNVTATLPGVAPTGLFAKAEFGAPGFERAAERMLQQAELTADSVARETLRAANHGRATAVIGRRASRLARLKRWAPSLASRLIIARAHQELPLDEAPRRQRG